MPRGAIQNSATRTPGSHLIGPDRRALLLPTDRRALLLPTVPSTVIRHEPPLDLGWRPVLYISDVVEGRSGGRLEPARVHELVHRVRPPDLSRELTGGVGRHAGGLRPGRAVSRRCQVEGYAGNGPARGRELAGERRRSPRASIRAGVAERLRLVAGAAANRCAAPAAVGTVERTPDEAHTRTLYQVSFAGSADLAPAEAQIAVDSRPDLGAPAVPSSVGRTSAFRVGGALQPRQGAGHPLVALACYRRERGSWALHQTVAATVADQASASRYAAQLRLRVAGEVAPARRPAARAPPSRPGRRGAPR